MNPMLTLLNQSNNSYIQHMMKMVMSAQNPQAALNHLISQNPQMAQVMQYVNQNGGDAKAAFYKLAQERGIDPNSILNQLK